MVSEGRKRKGGIDNFICKAYISQQDGKTYKETTKLRKELSVWIDNADDKAKKAE